MKIYIAASWNRKEEAQRLAAMLESLGIEITSQWIDRPPRPENVSYEEYERQEALIDVEDVLRCDVLVRLSDKEIMGFPLIPSSFATGARMFETGLAWHAGKEVIVIGQEQNVFDYLPGILILKDEQQLKEYLTIELEEEGIYND